MAIPARIDDQNDNMKSRRDHRRAITLETQGSLATGEAAPVTIHNVSAQGVLLETDVMLDVGETLEIALPDAGARQMEVVWSSGNLRGCKFAKALPKAALSAAILRSATGGLHEAALPGNSPSGETFALRIRRLRQANGMSLSDVATALGVSKPTVWAWEQGRAKPGSERIAALAQVLRVEPGTLLSGRNESGLRDLLSRCRAEVAKAYGTVPDNVRIAIELKD